MSDAIWTSELVTEAGWHWRKIGGSVDAHYFDPSERQPSFPGTVKWVRSILPIPSAEQLSTIAAERDAAVAERDRALEDLRRALEPSLIKAEFTPEGGEIRTYPTRVTQEFAKAITAHLDENKAANYIEMQLCTGEEAEPRIVVTAQRFRGKTPHQLRMQAEEARDSARAAAIEECARVALMAVNDLDGFTAAERVADRIRALLTTPPRSETVEAQRNGWFAGWLGAMWMLSVYQPDERLTMPEGLAARLMEEGYFTCDGKEPGGRRYTMTQKGMDLVRSCDPKNEVLVAPPREGSSEEGAP